ncbi:MAG: hypothetical protein A3E01_08420 [Gammaproteobacteria bacterium RIFCSPHIGHO2_12_FULL_63_22]|nr:MAG: hypothetical protein A3E01_08420 [Gammaproteobacteria bacterium RIFCSPHIGHO2_12_FULL_63_22]
MDKATTFALLLALSACSTTPTTYRDLGWAKGSAAQAEAECIAHVNSLAGFGSNVYLCMRGKGWEEN